MKYLIWSNEHEAWWGPGEYGYTNDYLEAGEYDQGRANAICFKANRYLPEGDMPNESCIPAYAVADIAKSAMDVTLRRWAHWKDGEQYVGSCGTKLADALKEMSVENPRASV